MNGTLSILVVGHPKLANDLRNPALEEIGARAKLFELQSIFYKKINLNISSSFYSFKS